MGLAYDWLLSMGLAYDWLLSMGLSYYWLFGMGLAYGWLWSCAMTSSSKEIIYVVINSIYFIFTALIHTKRVVKRSNQTIVTDTFVNLHNSLYC